MRYFLAFLGGCAAAPAFMVESAVRIVKGGLGLIFGAAMWFFVTTLLIMAVRWFVPGFDFKEHILGCFWAALALIILGGGLLDVLLLYSVERDERNRDQNRV